MNEILMLRQVRRLFINGTKHVVYRIMMAIIGSEMRKNRKKENGFWYGK